MIYEFSNCLILNNRLDYNAEIMYDCLIECSNELNAKIKYTKNKEDIDFFKEEDVIYGGVKFYNEEITKFNANDYRLEIFPTTDIFEETDNDELKFIDKEQDFRFVTDIMFNKKYKIELFN